MEKRTIGSAVHQNLKKVVLALKNGRWYPPLEKGTSYSRVNDEPFIGLAPVRVQRVLETAVQINRRFGAAIVLVE